MIRWMAEHKVASNLLMLIILLAGAMGVMNIKQEVFPEFEMDFIIVAVPYAGATPDEIEETILLPIEDSVSGINGIKKITATAKEGLGSLRIELLNDADKNSVFDDVQSAVERLTVLPDEADDAQVQLPRRRREVMSIALYGDAPTRSLIQLAQMVRDSLLTHPDVTQVEVEQPRGFEITLEISNTTLQQYALTLDKISGIIRQSTLDMPGGKIQTVGGDLLIRTKERRYTAAEYANIPVLTTDQGILRLGDIAQITDGFEESDLRSRYNGKPAERILVYRVGEQTPNDISIAVRSKLEELEGQLPSSVQLQIVNDSSLVLQDRIDLLMRNLWLGLGLVFLTLALFLRVDLSFWIMMGIPLSFAGAMIAMPAMDASINMISLFAFILVLGIVVDDAIVVGENIFAHQEMNKTSLRAAVDGTLEIGPPVLITILTTIAAFLPIYFIPGMTGKIFRNIPNVLIVVLLFSLVEAMFILPGHLSHVNRLINWILLPLGKLLEKPRHFFSRGLLWFSNKPYRATLEKGITYRYTIFAIGLFFIIICAGLVAGGHMKFTFFPKIDRDDISVTARMPFGTPASVSREIEEKMLSSAEKLLREYEAKAGHPVHEGIYSTVGRGGGHNTSVRVFLKPLDERGFASVEFSRKWRKSMGDIPGIEALNIRARHSMGSTYDIDVQLSHADTQQLLLIVEQFKDKLGEYPGVTNIEDSTEDGKREVQLRLSPAGRTLGLSTQELTQQVRAAFQGVEVFKILRSSDEISVKLRLPFEQRRYLRDLEDMVILAPGGERLPLGQVAELKYGKSYSSIRRVDGRRIVSVRGLVDSGISNTGEIVRSLKDELLPEIMRQSPQLQFSFEGADHAQSNTMAGVKEGGIVALLLIYCLLALQFRSYFQPFIIMTAIPFGIVGALLGHLLMGYSLSIISILGIVALTGIVVNDSLILVDFINRGRDEGTPIRKAVVSAGIRRFRPILLTTLTTFFGLLPMIFEQSLQARFLIPMAISLAFGVLFSTFVILILIPVLYMILEDFKGLVSSGSRQIKTESKSV